MSGARSRNIASSLQLVGQEGSAAPGCSHVALTSAPVSTAASSCGGNPGAAAVRSTAGPSKRHSNDETESVPSKRRRNRKRRSGVREVYEVELMYDFDGLRIREDRSPSPTDGAEPLWDPIRDLQDSCRAMGLPRPRFEVVERNGSGHPHPFVVRCDIGGASGGMHGRGRTVREAKLNAADQFQFRGFFE